MPINADFLSKLVCPKTRRPLRYATAEELGQIQAAIDEGTARTVGGAVVTDPLVEGLVPEEGDVAFPIRDGIPVLLTEEGIRIPDRHENPAS